MAVNPKSLANLKPIKPGEARNPKGRKSAGANIKEQINSLANRGLTAAELKRIARNPKNAWTRRAAAERILRTLEAPDLADFQDAVDGVSDLRSLRKDGLNTEVVKRMRCKTRTIPGRNGDEPTVEVEREIELHDRAGDDFDRIVEQTDGKPSQPIQHGGTIETSTTLKITFDE